MAQGDSNERVIKSVSIYLLLALIGLMMADLIILAFRDEFLPSQAPPAKAQQQRITVRKDRYAYSIVENKNIFNADGVIPPPVGASKEDEAAPDAPPVPSTLPIQLVGTIVHANPARSIATVLLRNKNEQVPVKVGGEIPDGLATVTLIERTKLTFRNSQSGRLEYIEMNDESRLSFNSAGPAQTTKQVGEVTQKSETEFELKRDDITKLTSNLPEVLQQARAVPRMGPGGQIECFSLADIKPGSIYERLGLRRGDCIKSVNGERIDSPGKAMDMYNALRGNANAIEIGIERGGRDESMNYSISN